MIELGINNVSKYYGATKIFENITFDIKTGERIGLIGHNGCGKTTILKIMMDLEDYKEGDIHLRKGAKIGYLNQIPVYDEKIKTIEVIRAAFEQISIIKNQMNQLEIQFEKLKGTELEKAIHQYGNLSEQYELDGGYDLETRINKITEGLQITDNLKEMAFNNLSGGEKTRVVLAKILLEEPDILLLDEPTNHLDLETIGWLEGFLKEYKGSVLIISHDRYFLDSVVNKVVELEYSRANIYNGNYSYFVVEKERRFLIDYKNYQNQQKKIEQMENQIKRYRIWGEMRDSDKMFKRAKELEKRLEKMEVLGRPVLDSKKVRFNQDIVNRTGKFVLEVEDISKSFEEKTLLKNINLNIFYQDSACIIGKNGSGTLAEYEGTLLFVSHDRYFINKVADKIMEIEDYEINTYDGDYNYYLEEIKKKKDNSISGINSLIFKSNKVVQIKKSDDSIRSKNADALRIKRLALIEENIEKMEIKQKELENEMNMHNSDIKYLEDIFLEKQTIEKELEAIYEEWEELIYF
ncbi:ABC-F family ATP-binding cassette domain-containing protein [Lachnoclostridium phytofermentans]|uniref:ABC transporter related n=1 Tax=Lachnoclostridium phytofermentans (strain ATCC 700394 / DSM 18823 / ISDg) TaxID=357809 RepID=A9KHK6_LACP7|nr:ABC-F family ATP-binding cassette domain-containing protein [Lachnoclostridium phytofermentans]ABX42291.1 ABC transporter related [Lachnoclostridium phytofermentans ISDg]